MWSDNCNSIQTSMAVCFRPSPISTLPCSPFPSSSPSRSTSSRSRIAACSSASVRMENHSEGRRKFMEFPYVSPLHRGLMVDLVTAVEDRLDSELLPCTLPPEVQNYENESGTAHGSLQIRSAQQSSPVEFILGSWLHCQLPTGGALNITSLSAYLKSSTDAPNLLIEIIQSSPTTLVLILDLTPRKDLVLHPNYLKTFYEETQLETRRQMLEKIPEVRPYISSSLYIRCLVSPTAIMVRIETEEGGVGRLEEIVKSHVDPVAKEVLEIWLDKSACGDNSVPDSERAYLEKRDELIKRKIIEIDLGSNMPRLFGLEISDKIVAAIAKVFNITA